MLQGDLYLPVLAIGSEKTPSLTREEKEFVDGFHLHCLH
jgi:hypothetical protein